MASWSTIRAGSWRLCPRNRNAPSRLRLQTREELFCFGQNDQGNGQHDPTFGTGAPARRVEVPTVTGYLSLSPVPVL